MKASILALLLFLTSSQLRAGDSPIELMPESLSLKAAVDATASAVVVVKNVGKAALEELRIVPVLEKRLRASDDCPPRLAAGASCKVTVSFKPTDKRLYKGWIDVLARGSRRIFGVLGDSTAAPTSSR